MSVRVCVCVCVCPCVCMFIKKKIQPKGEKKTTTTNKPLLTGWCDELMSLLTGLPIQLGPLSAEPPFRPEGTRYTPH